MKLTMFKADNTTLLVIKILLPNFFLHISRFRKGEPKKATPPFPKAASLKNLLSYQLRCT